MALITGKSDYAKIIWEILNREGRINLKMAAAKLRVSPKTVSTWESGGDVPCKEHKKRIRAYLLEVRKQRLIDVRNMDSPLGRYSPDPDELESLDKKEKEQAARDKELLKMESPW